MDPVKIVELNIFNNGYFKVGVFGVPLNIPNSLIGKVFQAPKMGIENNHTFKFYGLTLVANSNQSYGQLEDALIKVLYSIPSHMYLHSLGYELTGANKLHLHCTIECASLIYKDIPCAVGYGRKILELKKGSDKINWIHYSRKKCSNQDEFNQIMNDHIYRQCNMFHKKLQSDSKHDL